ncbi:MAG: hypothetical protein COY77_00105 [Candidatus Omnitrophica bacterium CG_4_10_14_0_8_um_filter_43_18]|nr:MAG: hypothetical protein COY77_00105 [Candidatus Omnitrophica bacterium CG_4_10_14_0_8_um_filter_43_18]
MENKAQKWYFKTSIIVVAFLCVGPLALPLVWFNPRFSLRTKLIISVIAIALTYYLTALTMDAINKIVTYYKQMGLTF